MVTVNPVTMQPSSIKELETALEAAKQAERETRNEAEKRLNDLRKAFHAIKPYDYTACKIDSIQGAWELKVKIQDEIRISRNIDPIRRQVFCDLHGITIQDLEGNKDTRQNAMNYYLTLDGIINNTGGGTLLLKVPQLCSPTEWKQIKAGNIPAKFIL